MKRYNVGRRNGRTMYKSEEVDIEFDVSDVCEFITDYADESEIDEIIKVIDEMTVSGQVSDRIVSNGLEGTLVSSMKIELLQKAHNKYSLQELEERLGDLL